MPNPTDYIPHALVGALAAIVTWVFRDHAKRDDARFDAITEIQRDLNKKLDAQDQQMADNHAEILRLLLKEKRQ